MHKVRTGSRPVTVLARLLYPLIAGLLILGLIPLSASGDSPSSGGFSLQAARADLEGRRANINGFVGIAHQNGQIVVFLENEAAKGGVPDTFDGFPVNKIVTGKFWALGSPAAAAPVMSPPEQVEKASPASLPVRQAAPLPTRSIAFRPLKAGVSIFSSASTSYYGTLGMLTYDNKILSNAHVLAMDPTTGAFVPIGTGVIQPAGSSSSRVGTLQQYVPLNFNNYSTPNYCDAAIATIDGGITGSSGVVYGESGDYSVAGTTTVSVGDTIRKSGATSGITTGTVTATNADLTVSYTGSVWAYYQDQIIGPASFISAGDSGSCVDKGGQFVGLAFAGSATQSVICKASYIISGLGISVSPPLPAAPVLISPANGGTAAGTSIMFTWNSVSNATNYYMSVVRSSDHTILFSQPLGNVTSYTVGGFPNDGTQYIWAVNAGNVSGWGPASAIWSFANGTVPIPATPVLSSPADGATASGTSVTFQWNASTYANNYLLTVVKASDNTSFFIQTVGNVTTYAPGSFPNDGTSYKWTAAAGNSSGWSSPAAWRTFSNGTTPLPAAPILISPANGSTAAGTSIIFTWNSVSNATNYYMSVVRSSDHTILFSQPLGNVTSYTVGGFPNDGTQYIWAVNAGNSLGWGPASAIWSFANGTVPVPATPVLSSPADGATASGTSVTFQWNASTYANNYLLTVVKTSDNTSFFIQTVGNVTTYAPGSFPNDGTSYKWTAVAGNSSGWSNPAAWRTFSNGTAPLPAAPILISPANGGTAAGTSIIFTWNSVSNATNYYMSVVRSSDHTILFSQPLGNVTSYTVGGFPNNGTQYIWAVNAGNSLGWGPASAIWSFTNGVSPLPAAPVLISPANGGTTAGTSIIFTWNSVSNATNYYMSVVRSSDHTILFSQPLGNVTSYMVGGFPNNGTQYIWAVNAGNSLGWGPASVIWSFTNGP